MFGLALIALGALLPTDPGFFPIEMAAAAPAELALPSLVSRRTRAVAQLLRAQPSAGPRSGASSHASCQPLLPRRACRTRASSPSAPPAFLPLRSLPVLQGYGYDALEPHIDEATMVSKEQVTDPASALAGAAAPPGHAALGPRQTRRWV